ncbi:hypothetical protein ACIQWB_35215 [Streptomyces olivaceus]|uniref:hypothetical protein n=1 Tax=Streptomyces olivaceus TaxID=47716 RepID=UPI0037FAF876
MEVLAYELMRARLDGDEARAHLLVRRMPRRELLALLEATTGIALESVTGVLRASGHADPEGFVRGILERASSEAVDGVLAAQAFEDPPPFTR